jgi:hypothetical protein
MSDVNLTEVHDREVGERERSIAYSIGLAVAFAIVIFGFIYAVVLIGRTVAG